MADLNGETHQSLSSLLCTDERDYLIRNNGEKVLVSELVGKTVGLYFFARWSRHCRDFTPELVKVYNKLKDKGEAFEIVLLSWDQNQKAFEKYYRSKPWLALPFADKSTKESLKKIYGVEHLSTLVVVYPDGKVVNDARDAIRTYGYKAYPFTDAHLETLRKEIEEHGKTDDTTDEDEYSSDEDTTDEEDPTDEDEEDTAYYEDGRVAVESTHYEDEEDTAYYEDGRVAVESARYQDDAVALESFLVSHERNFVINHGGDQVLVSDLVEKSVGLYFSAYWCHPCRLFTPELVKAYNELKEKGEEFEIVFISFDQNEEHFEKYYGSMPWLALPYADKKTRDALRDFCVVKGIPELIVVHDDNLTDFIAARRLIDTYGAKAYPFTYEHLQTLKNKIETHEKADSASKEGHEKNADAAIDENSKPA